MSRGESESRLADFSLDYRRDFVLPIMMITGLAAVAISLMLVFFSIQADRQELRTEQEAAGITMRTHLKEMRQYLVDCSSWDVGYTKLVVHMDSQWATSVIGPYLFKTQGFENSFVINAQDKTTYASSGSAEAKIDAFKYVGTPLKIAIKTLRAKRGNSDLRFTGLTKTADGKVAAFAVAPIVPDTAKIKAPSTSLSFLVLVDALNSDDLSNISAVHQLQDLHLTTTVDYGANYVLRDPQGVTLAGLSWTPRRPGAALRYAGAPIVMVVLALLVFAARRVLQRARRAQAQVQRLASYDSLTGLRNRASFVRSLDELIAVATPFALLSIDLDRFKAVNDQFGHLIGDEVLVEVARRLSEQCSSGDMLARVGGDEFVLLLIGGDTVRRTTVSASSIIAALEPPIATDRVEVSVGASIGIASHPDDGRSPIELRQAADLALYRAKESGRGTACFYNEEMDASARERHVLEVELRDALEKGEIGLAFQPVFSIVTGEITSFEALARWSHARRGPIPPSDFISLAEECGLIERLGAQLLHKASAEATRWPDHIRVAVNLSPLQFKSERLCDSVRDVLAATGLRPERLQLEVTESLLIRDVDRTFRQLEQLRAVGIQILMDDFGVGYSSLSYFERFPFDKVKIDRSFIDTAPSSPASQAIIKAVVQLGTTLNMGVVAEGVETREQLEMLTAFGCTHAQGYLLGRPMPVEDLASVLQPTSTDLAA